MSRDQDIQDFVRAEFGPRGTWRLHRVALGWDLLRAPLNLVLAPVFLLVRLLGFGAARLGWGRVAGWLLGRKILLKTAVAREVEGRLEALFARWEAAGVPVEASPARKSEAVETYVGVRSAMAEIVTMGVVLTAGLVLFRAATPGVVSLAGPVARLSVELQAIERFPLGPFLGRAWYGVFPVEPAGWQVVIAALALSVVAALITTFAGLLADPLQVVTGMHRRRLSRLVARLEAGGTEGLAREHLAARMGDMSDIALSVWRTFRG